MPRLCCGGRAWCLRPSPRDNSIVRCAKALFVIAAGFLFGCAPATSDVAGSPQIKVAAAANLSRAFPAIAKAFTAETDVKVVFTFGATAYLAHQIESGAPFDLYAAADVEHVEGLVAKGLIVPESSAVYAHGRLVLWTSDGRLTTIEDLTSDRVRFVAIAKPEIAPYGRAAVETLESLGLWSSIKAKIVYAQNVTMAKQLVDSGNAEAAFVAAGLLDPEAVAVSVDLQLYSPIQQGLGVVAGSARRGGAERFAKFLMGKTGQDLLRRSGYDTPRHASRM